MADAADMVWQEAEPAVRAAASMSEIPSQLAVAADGEAGACTCLPWFDDRQGRTDHVKV